jgi:hypothetical protein
MLWALAPARAAAPSLCSALFLCVRLAGCLLDVVVRCAQHHREAWRRGVGFGVTEEGARSTRAPAYCTGTYGYILYRYVLELDYRITLRGSSGRTANSADGGGMGPTPFSPLLLLLLLLLLYVPAASSYPC